MMSSNKGYQKSYFDVLGICCPSEVPLIERILKPLEGVQRVSVIVPSRTVIVVHDPLLVPPCEIVKALNQARLEASIRAYGGEKVLNTWPSPYIVLCAILLIISLFKIFYHPLRWFALGAVAVGLPPIFLRSVIALRRLTLDINILMLIAVCGAVALRDYSEAGFIVVLFTTAEWLETLASHKATAGMTSLMSMAPQKAVLEETGETIDVGEVKINSLIAVKAGEIIPIDGVVEEGTSEVDEKSLTGESFPVSKQAGSQVWAGTLNIDGYLSVRTTAMAENSAVAKMARLVEEAQTSHSRTQRLIDTCAKYYTPGVVLMSAGVAFIPLIMRVHNQQHWFKLALVLLVSACPCALVLSTPIATFCALVRAAKMGLLVKGGDVLEDLSKVKVAAFDKTGTITRGEFTVKEFRVLNSDISLQTLLFWVSSAESKSSHPMASALVEYARSNSVEPKPDDVSEFQIFAGEGIFGQIDGKNIYVGNKRIVARASCQQVPSMDGLEGMTVGYVVYGQELVGVFTLSDSCRTGSKEAIQSLRSLGIKSVMLTGDSTTAANFAQNQLNNALEAIHAELLPSDKVRVLNDLKSQVGSTMMIGDGMNDAPALATANVGISMGVSGSAVATETSHITLMSNDIRKIPQAVRLARRTHRTVLTNIIFSIITKAAILGIALAGHPLLWAAVLADVGTCLLVILNSMLLLRLKNAKVDKKKHCSRSEITSSCKSEKCCTKPDCCNEEKVNKGHNSCLKSCNDHGHAAKAEPKQCQSNCCNEPPKVVAKPTCQSNCCEKPSKVEAEPTPCQSNCCEQPSKVDTKHKSCQSNCCEPSKVEAEPTPCQSNCCEKPSKVEAEPEPCRSKCCDKPPKVEAEPEPCRSKCCEKPSKVEAEPEPCRSKCCDKPPKVEAEPKPCRSKCCEKPSKVEAEPKPCQSKCCDKPPKVDANAKPCQSKCCDKPPKVEAEPNKPCQSNCCNKPPKVEAKPKSCQSKCCSKPVKVEENACQKHCCSGSNVQTHSEKHSQHGKEPTNGKANSYHQCKQTHKTCHDEIKTSVHVRGGVISPERNRCNGEGSSRREVPEMRCGGGGCCSKSYREEVARREGHANGCCENGRVRLPEIITE